MICDLIERGIRDRHHLGAQLCASIDGQTTVDVVIGEARPGVSLTPDTLMLWKSSTKPIVAAAVMQCVERGELRLDDTVVSHIPEFGQAGKTAVTVRHLLTHTGGFRLEPFDYPDDPWQSIIEKICAMPLEDGWTPGQTAGYHATTSWFILGELVQRATGEFLPDYLRESILEPLGMTDCYVGMPGDVYDRYAEDGRIAALPVIEDGVVREDTTHTRDWLTHCSPGSSGLGPMRQLVRFYEMMLGGGEREGRRVLSPESVGLKTRRHRSGLYDLTFAYEMDWGLGVMLDKPGRGGRVPYGFGRHASPDTFGHGGVQSSAAFADPRHDLAVAVAFVGMPGERIHQHRIDTVLTALYEDLGLA